MYIIKEVYPALVEENVGIDKTHTLQSLLNTTQGAFNILLVLNLSVLKNYTESGVTLEYLFPKLNLAIEFQESLVKYHLNTSQPNYEQLQKNKESFCEEKSNLQSSSKC
jgi:hypothetical protein